jgi:Ca2+-binding EF-hand superfamily protein
MSDEIRAVLNNDVKLSEVAVAVFQVVDTDNSGQIDKEELGKAINQFAEEFGLSPIDDDSINKVFTSLDTDQSGKLSIDEFKVFVRKTLELLLEVC